MLMLRWIVPLMLVSLALAGCTYEHPQSPASIAGKPSDPAPVVVAPWPPVEPEDEAEPEPEPEAEPEPEPVPPLEADAGGPYVGYALEWVPVTAAYSGGEGEVSCAWSGDAEFLDASSCATHASASDVGNWTISVEVRRGGETVEAMADLDSDLPVATGMIMGRPQMYDDELETTAEVDAGSLLTHAGQDPTYIVGRSVVLSARSVWTVMHLDTAEVTAVVFSEDGQLMLGPVEASVTDDADRMGNAAGSRFDTEPLVLKVPKGSYLLAFRVDLDGDVFWVKAEDSDVSGHMRFVTVALDRV